MPRPRFCIYGCTQVLYSQLCVRRNLLLRGHRRSRPQQVTIYVYESDTDHLMWGDLVSFLQLESLESLRGE
jgi:hypothetical protein